MSNEDSMSSDINILPKAMELSALDDDDINEDVSVTDGTCFGTIKGTVSSNLACQASVGPKRVFKHFGALYQVKR